MGVIRETLKDFRLQAIHQTFEVIRVCCPSRTAREHGRLLNVNTSIVQPRVAIYARISEDTQGDAAGVERQLTDARELAATRGWRVIAEHSDNDISALTGKRRPGYEQILELVRAGKLDHVIVWQTSRLLRNRKERAEAIELFGHQRVGIITVKGQDLDLSTAYGRGMAGLLGEFDTMESEVKSERRQA